MNYGRKNQRKAYIILLIMIIISLSLDLSFATNKSISEKGYVDATNFDFHEDGLLPLDGYWEMYWLSLLEPGDFEQLEIDPNYVYIPGELTSQDYNGGKFSSDGYGTLRKIVKVKDLDELYGLKAKYLSSSNKIWVNGNLLFSSGKVTTNKLESLPKYIPAEVYFMTDTDEVEIIIQISNFHHRRIRLNEVIFGKADHIEKHTNMGIIKESFLFGSLVLIAFYYGVLYFIQKREKASLYLALISFSVATRVVIINERILIRLLPNLPGEFMMKLGYFPVLILLPLITIYIKELFQDKENQKILIFLKNLVVMTVIFVLITSIRIYDYVFEFGKYFIIIGAIYIIYLIATKDTYKNAKGYKVMVLGGFILLGTAINDILREFDIINSFELFSFGMVLFIAIQALFLAWRFNESYIQARSLAEENESMYEEIQGLNKDLESKIKERTIELEALNKKLEEISNLDSLTGLYNRRYFVERLNQEWSRAYRGGYSLSIIMIDIDFFKNFNDNYGHLKGDDCLKDVAHEIKRSIRRCADFVARYGGEEFVVLLPGVDSKGAFKIAEEIKTNIENLRITHEYSQVSNVVTVSLGVHTVFVLEEMLKNEFVDKADKGLYLAKKNGRNRVEVYKKKKE